MTPRTQSPFQPLAAGLALCTALVLAPSAKAQQDRFAQIGGQGYDLRRHELIEPAPPILPNITLPVGIGSAAPLAFRQRRETKEALRQELDSMRKVFAPFLKDHSPLRDDHRRRLPIARMDWRLQTAADAADFASVLQGKGDWKDVAIPHYGPPVGHAVAYYSKTLVLDDDMLSRGSLFLVFRGVDYKAEVFFNGVPCGRHEGFFAPFDCDVTKLARKGENRLVVKVVNEPTTTGSSDGKGGHVVGDKIYAAGGPGWDEPDEGWHICPPGMGIYQDAYLEARAPLFVHDMFVRPLPEQDSAELWIEIFNATQQNANASLSLSLFGENFPDTLFEAMGYTPATTVVPGIGDMVKPTDWQQKPLPLEYGANYLRIPLRLKGARRWDPDHPWLYDLQATLLDANGRTIDAQSSTFGMRSFRMDTVSIPKGRMYLNGKPIRLRGANSMGFEQNDVMRKDWAQLTDDILLARLCHMNFLRFTQRPVQREVYDYCDRLGMLTQTDLPFFGAARIPRFAEAVKQAEEMERLIRPHPSAIVVTYMNERFPNAEGSPQRSYANAAEVMRLFTALDQAVLLSNPDRVIKPGDGDYDPPGPGLPDNHCYNTWYNGHALDLGKFHKGYWQLVKPGWLYGCGEYGAEGLDPLHTMRKYYPAAWLPKDAAEERSWMPGRISKSQTQIMHLMWYPTPQGLQGWVDASQRFQAWAVRFVTEAFRRDARNVSSAVHLFIDAWPAGWMKAIMDVDRQPKPAYFAYREALAPLMLSLRTDRFAGQSGDTVAIELWACNDRNDVPAGCTVAYEVSVDGRVLIRRMLPADIASNDPRYQGMLRFPLPEVRSRTKALVRAGLFDAQGRCLHDNSLEIDIHPRPAASRTTVALLSNTAATLAAEMGLTVVPGLDRADVCIIDRYADYEAHREAVDAFVRRGGRAILTEWPEGRYAVAGTMVDVQRTIMGDYFFANPAPRLLATGRLAPQDLFLWYDARVGYIQPLLRQVFRAPGWSPLVTTGLTNFSGADPTGYLAAADLRLGRGRFVFSTVSLAGRLRENPAARQLLTECIKP
jgi:hypothetical protein